MLQRFECGSVIEIYNGIMFDFYPRLSHMYTVVVPVKQVGSRTLIVYVGLGGASGRLVLRRWALLHQGFFCWSFGSVPRRISCGEYTCLCVRLGWQALNRGRIYLVTAIYPSNGICTLVMACALL